MKKVSASAQLAPDTHCIRWQTAKCPFTIEYAPDVLEEIRQAAMDAFFSVPHGGAEIGGVLFGIREPGCVRILAARPLQCDYANGPTFTLSERDHQRLQLLLASQEFHNQGWVPLGWYHSHTRSELLLSVRDLEIHDRYFTDALDIALVVKPHTFEPMRAGFFFREPDGTIHNESSYEEFRLLSGAAPMPRAVAIRAEGLRRSPSAAIRPEARQVRRSAPRWQWFAVLAVLIGGLGVGWATLFRRSAPAPPPTVSLMAYDLDGQLQIHWDRASARVKDAVFGSLEITDGAAKTLINLEPAQLRNGSFSYARQNARVDLRLVMVLPDARSFQEFTTFLGRAPRSSVWDAGAETAALRQELRKQAVRTRQLQDTLDDMQAEMVRQQRNRQRQAVSGGR